MKVTIMKVTIFGPNLPDQSLGQFHVHPKDSKAAARMVAARGHIIERSDEEVDSVQEIIEACYSDQIAESGENWKAYLGDFHINAVISATLPHETEGCLFKEPYYAGVGEAPKNKDLILDKALCALKAVVNGMPEEIIDTHVRNLLDGCERVIQVSSQEIARENDLAARTIPAVLPEETIDSDTKLEKAMTAMIEALAEELKVAEIESTGYSDMFRDDLRRAISSVKRIRRYY